MASITPMQELRAFLSTQSSANILRLALGISVPGAPALAEHLIFNCIDCESFEWDHDFMTEIGLCCFDSRDVRLLVSNPGPHAENIFQKAHFYHFRVLENAHHVNLRFCPGDPESSRFTKPELGNCPIIFLGHAITNDLQMLNKTSPANWECAVEDPRPDLDPSAMYCVLRAEMVIRLVTTLRTLISAVLMVLQRNLPVTEKTAQQVVDDLEKDTQNMACSYGIPVYCTRCGRTNHLRSQCRARVKCVRCEQAWAQQGCAHAFYGLLHSLG
ncbi:hypothetical protein K458DRAFT_393585 [Lentithecium fluviatile CBS 122367]|uniref:Gfd2/YDR514C-like C-terminal domain-containing protein n=1 Tax=Lentithecium fluviatile CBS 122367 TaxID=1168545 RepID=A0A6G1IP30_9PLEO|nr:hypothetical protein K458DRAFT_393585 [Lentithecium fluviatile CBS 122367]